ncbi:hypothetical protein Tco_1559919 [Tanacetum coccineum]
MTPFETRVRQDTDEIYTRLDDEQSQRQLLAGRLNMLFRDRRAHTHTRFLIETEVRMSREAWVGSMGASDLARAEEMDIQEKDKKKAKNNKAKHGMEKTKSKSVKVKKST